MAQEPTDFAAYFEERGLGGGGGGVSVGSCLLLLVALAGIHVAGLGLACVERMHHAILTLCGVAGYGAFVGWTVFAVYRSFRRSSGWLFALFALGFSLVALHADWFWFFVLEGKGFLIRPDALFAGLSDVFDTRQVDVVFQGRHRSSVQTISGGALAACCVLEAVAIFGLAGLVARLLNRGAFFCDDCGRWASCSRTLPPLYVRIPEAMALVTLAKGDVSPLRTANPVPNGPGDEPFVATVRYCADCRRGMLWVSRQKVVGRGAKRRRTTTRIGCLQRIPLAPEAVRTLMELAS